jgi:hypothetical protein
MTLVVVIVVVFVVVIVVVGSFLLCFSNNFKRLKRSLSFSKSKSAKPKGFWI